MSEDRADLSGEAAEGQERKRGLRLLFAFLPLILFAGLAAIFFLQLGSGRDASEIPSVLIGVQAPSLSLEPLEGLTRDGAPVPGLTDAAIEGRLSLVNVFASWCVPCRQEHPILMQLAADERVTLVGINYKDPGENALRFLGELGNPYTAVGVDPRGQASIDWGVYGIPETFLVGTDGTVLYKQIGPFTPEAVEGELMPLIAKHARP